MLRRIKRRVESTVAVLENIQIRPASALREVLAEGYGAAGFRADLMAGIVVGIVALPLSMALAIASGVPPQHGLYTAIVAGLVTSLLGGSRVQVSGPTAAFVVILEPIAVRYGLGGLLVATTMAGVLLVVLGLARLGRLIQFIPYPVTTGFTAGIGTVLATLQLKDLLGLSITEMPEHYTDRVLAIVAHLPQTRVSEAALGAFTLFVLLAWPRINRSVPGPLVALSAGALLAVVLARLVPGFEVATVATRFHYELDGVLRAGIPSMPPTPGLPWAWPGPDGGPLHMSFGLVKELAPAAFAIAMLGAIESLLSAVVADGMTGTRHDPDAELVAQGTANLIGPFFGAIASTGAIARTATNVRAGARSPIAAAVHAVFVLLAMVLLAPVLGYLPMASLAALLILVAWNMSDAKHFLHMLRIAPKSDVTVLVTCFLLTVLFDMTIAVSVGVMLAALLFMRRMAEISGATMVEGAHPTLAQPLPPGVVLYRIAGPLFFGAAQKAMSSLDTISSGTRVVILDMTAVPAMDATGLVGLSSSLDRLARDGTIVVLAGVQEQPARVLAKAGIEADPPTLLFRASVAEALAAVAA